MEESIKKQVLIRMLVIVVVAKIQFHYLGEKKVLGQNVKRKYYRSYFRKNLVKLA